MPERVPTAMVVGPPTTRPAGRCAASGLGLALVRAELDPADQPVGGSAAGSAASESRRGKSGSGVPRRPGSAAWRPHASSSSSGGPPLPSGRVGVGVAELRERARRDRGHERRGGERDQPDGLDEVAEHAREPRPCGRGVGVVGLGRLGERPRLLGLDEAVGLADEVPQRGERVVQEQAVELRDVRVASVRPRAAPAARRAAARAPAARRRGTGRPSRPCGSRGCRSRWRGRRCSAARSCPRRPRRPCRTATSRSVT